MKQIPASLQKGPQRSIVLPDASLTWYRARPDGPPGRFLVTQPTLSFVRTGMKHLQPHGAEEHLVVSAGSVVTMGAGIHVMTELGGGAPHYERTVLSVSPALLQSLLGARGGDSARTPAAVAPTPPRLCTMLSPPSLHPTPTCGCGKRCSSLRAFRGSGPCCFERRRAGAAPRCSTSRPVGGSPGLGSNTPAG